AGHARAVNEKPIARAEIFAAPATVGTTQPRMLRRGPRIGHAKPQSLAATFVPSLRRTRVAAPERDFVDVAEVVTRAGQARALRLHQQEQVGSRRPHARGRARAFVLGERFHLLGPTRLIITSRRAAHRLLSPPRQGGSNEAHGFVGYRISLARVR